MKKRNLPPQALAAILMWYSRNVGAESPDGVQSWKTLKAELVTILDKVDPTNGALRYQNGVPFWSFYGNGSAFFTPPGDRLRSTLQILGPGGVEMRVVDSDSDGIVDTIDVVRHYQDGISRLLEIRNLPGENAKVTFRSKPEGMFEAIVSDTEGVDPFQ